MKTSQEINNLMAKYYYYILRNDKSKEVEDVRYYLYKRKITREDIKAWKIGYAMDNWSAAIKYLKEKGYNDIEIRKAGISAKANHGNYFDRFRGRIMFSIKNENKQVVGFTGRALHEYSNDIKVAKYLNSPDSPLFNKSAAIFGIDKAIKKIPSKGCIIVMEGQFDVVMAHKYKITNAVACSGTSLSAGHLKILKGYTDNIIICFDNDTAGESATIKSILKGKEIGLNIEIIRLEGGNDPDEVLRGDKYGLDVMYAYRGDNFIISKFLEEKDSKILLDYLLKLKVKDQDKFLNRLEARSYETAPNKKI